MKKTMPFPSRFLRFLSVSALTLLLQFCSFEAVFAQELNTTSAHFCLYEASMTSKKLVLSPAESSMEELKNTLLKGAEMPSNFRFYAANVPSVAAIVSGTERFVLYNKRYFDSLKPVQKALLLAHAIGHHAQKHRLKDGLESEEEMEADEFAGFALYFMDIEFETIERDICPIHRLKRDTTLRKNALQQGLKRGEMVLKISPNMAYSEKEMAEMLKNMPVFTLPPPLASAEIDLTPFFSTCQKYENVNGMILHALDETGYFAKKYYRTQGNGFAIVTKMEQFNKNGASKEGPARWTMKPVRNDVFSIENYLKSMFIPESGLFRVIVFVVDDTYKGNSNPDVKLTRDTALAWLNVGYTSLPTLIGDKPTGRQTTVNALIYEFQVPETTKRFNFSKPSALDGRTHLQMAKILANLRR